MTQHKTRNFRPGSSTGAEIGTLISAPLIAVSNANSAMAREQAKFLMEFCFSQHEESYSPVMIEMQLNRGVLEPDANEKDGFKVRNLQSTFQVPLLTMIPINSLAVETFDVEFDLEISSQHSHDEELSDTSDVHSKVPVTKLKGKISYDSDEKANHNTKDQYRSQNSSKLKVNVHGSQLPLPVGVTLMIDLYSKTMNPVLMDKDKSKPKTS